MAIPTNIKTLLSGEVVEWARIEFKETWDPAASLKTVCAFAVRRHIVGGANRTLFSVDLPPRLCRTGT